MAYLVLARKYRPSTFSEVVGQEHVTRTLRNAIRSGRLGHAFLFSGLRGVGKTSVARILAKTLNCSDAEHVDEPCGVCDSCREVDESRSLDVVEMDAASHTGVDDIRELREAVMYAPGAGKTKVYIIDEVHMLSKNAFNALLKTLEEPPPRVVFILATTEPHKVPVTIHSRCQRYDFRRIPSAAMADHLGEICRKEGVSISRDSLRRIAIAAEGSLRDSQSLLDQILSFSGTEVSDEDVATVLGSLDRDQLAAILGAVMDGRAGEALRAAAQMIDGGADPVRMALDLIEMLRALMLMVEMEKPEDVLDLPEGEMKLLGGMVASADPALLRVRFTLLARGEERMRRAPQPRFHLELALVHMAHASELLTAAAQAPPVRTPPRGGKPDPESGRQSEDARASETGEAEMTKDLAVTAAPAFAAIETPEETWEALVRFITGRSPSIGSMLEQLVCVKIAGGELVIGGRKGELFLDFLEEREKKAELEGLAGEFFSRPIAVRLISMEESQRSASPNLNEKRERKESDLNRRIRRETLDHNAIRSALEIFQGEVVNINVLGGSATGAGDGLPREEDS